jgi:hypothetical protein
LDTPLGISRFLELWRVLEFLLGSESLRVHFEWKWLSLFKLLRIIDLAAICLIYGLNYNLIYHTRLWSHIILWFLSVKRLSLIQLFIEELCG